MSDLSTARCCGTPMDLNVVSLDDADALSALICHCCHAIRWYHRGSEVPAGEALALAMMNDLKSGHLVIR